jgi:hypothetical protein
MLTAIATYDAASIRRKSKCRNPAYATEDYSSNRPGARPKSDTIPVESRTPHWTGKSPPARRSSSRSEKAETIMTIGASRGCENFSPNPDPNLFRPTIGGEMGTTHCERRCGSEHTNWSVGPQECFTRLNDGMWFSIPAVRAERTGSNAQTPVLPPQGAILCDRGNCRGHCRRLGDRRHDLS